MSNHFKSNESKSPGKDAVFLTSVCLLMFLKRFLLLNFEINYEEGKEIECILNVMEGKMVYRDFHWQYGPLGIYSIAWLFKLFGQVNLLIPRMVVTLIAVATTYFSYKAARFFLSSRWAFWAALMASSGLVARENTYGHGFAYLGMVASFYFLLKYFEEGKTKNLFAAGLGVFLTLLAKPVVFGVGALAAAVSCMVFWHLVVRKTSLPFVDLVFLLSCALVPAGALYGYLTFQTSIDIIYGELFPMSTGRFNLGDKFLVPPLWPELGFFAMDEWISEINQYLVRNFRWWLIVFTFLGGAIYLIRFHNNWEKNSTRFAYFFFLLIYLLLIESETLLLVNRPITFFINMLPNYILLACFLDWLKNKGWLHPVHATAFLFALFYFFYPPLRLGIYHAQYSKTLNLPYAKTIAVPPYTLESYRSIISTIKKEAPEDKPIVFAGYDSFIYLFSGREFYFPEDFSVFIRTSFHPYNRDNKFFSKSLFDFVEKKIVRRIQTNPPGMILIPAQGITDKVREASVFLTFVKEHWRLEKTLNTGKSPGPFDKIHLTMDIYLPKSENFSKVGM